MCYKYYFLIYTFLFLDSYGLNCRSEGGPKENELRTIYRNCLRKLEMNSNESQRHIGGHSGQGWREPREQTQRPDWEDTDRSDNKHDRSGIREDRKNRKEDRVSRRDEGMGNKDYNMGDSRNRFGNRNGNMGGRDSKMGGRDDGMSNRNANTGNQDGRLRPGDHLDGREDFSKNDEFGDGMPGYDMYNPTNHPYARYKRERRLEKNSGQRSQYNPNIPRPSPDYEDSFHDNENNSSQNMNKETETKACAIHCFLEELKMTGDNGMPDRNMVAQVITKDVKDEDLREFLQEAIEDCFQILYNENTENNCKFSKALMMCLSEKGRANCDDWREDMQF